MRNTSGLKRGGQPGRKAGIPNKVNAPLKAYAGQYTREAIDGLLAIARGSKVPPAARVGAWREILDRAVGKPPQAVTGEDGRPLFPPGGITFIVQEAADSDNQT